jgi:uncharacterized protein involved in exopolysaccharide biosynthesis
VIDDLGLTEKWNKHRDQLKKEDSLQLLREMLTLRLIKNTSIVEIRATSTDANEARNIANKVAFAYGSFSGDQRKSPKMEAVLLLQARAREELKNLDAAQERVDALFAKLPIFEAVDEGNAGHVADAERKLQALCIEAQAQLMHEEALLRGLKELPQEQLPQALPTAVSDTLLVSLLEQCVFVEQRLTTVQKEFGPEHIEVLKAVSQREDLQRKIQQRVDGIMIGLETKVKSLRQNLDNLQKEAATLRETELERVRASRPYFKAKRELEGLQRSCEAINASLAAARVQMSLPTRLVDIIDTATAPTRPASPNRPKATACILLGVLLNIAGLKMLRNKPGLLSLHPAAAPT